jgi:uncharacterized iron-regulated membrane protein
MEPSLRKSMAWLHTWAGVLFSALLFTIFWMGTLSVFDREIDRWMMPATRLALPAAAPSLDVVVRPAAERLAAGAKQWNLVMPTERVPAIRLTWRDAADDNHIRYLDPVSGQPLPEVGTHGGSGFIYPLHYRLNLSFMDIGRWVVGVAGMAMLLLMVSGVIIHKKIFREFFTFRPAKPMQRAALDLHNLSGVLVLPFHFLIVLSGLIIFFATYFPSGWQAAYDGDRKAFNAEAAGSYQRSAAKKPGLPASLDEMAAQARSLWGADGENTGLAQLRIYHPGDARSYVELRRTAAERINADTQALYFDAVGGHLLARAEPQAMRGVQRFISGLHQIQFRHWTLRWLYFLAGLAGCVLIATGLLIWLAARRVQHAKKGLAGVRVVEAIAVAGVPGLLLATLSFFIANRLLPADLAWAGAARADLEMWAFFATWLLALLHACWRGPAAWAQQTLALAPLALATALLNWAGTGAHPLHAIAQGQYGVAGMDLLLLLMAGLAVLAARRLRRGPVVRARALPVVREGDYA